MVKGLIDENFHAVRGIMGNQGKIAKKQSGEIYVFLHISILSFIFEKKLFLQVEKPHFSIYQHF